MARPFTATDEDILLAARKVMNSRGPDAFSMAEVASEVGLSRAAIILRFKSTQALKIAALKKQVQEFSDALATLPQTPSGDHLLRIAAFIGFYAGSRESSLRFFATYYTSNAHDRDLFKLEIERGAALDAAIAKVMPKNALERDSAVLAFRAHITGTIMAWLALENVTPYEYMIERTCEWLKLANIAFSDATATELLTAQPKESKRSRAKTTRAAKQPARRSKVAKTN